MYMERMCKAIQKMSIGKKTKEIEIQDLVNVFKLLKQNGNTLYFVGNGGSAGIAIHMTADFLKNGGMRTHSMHEAATLTCIGNDFGYEYVFSKQLELVAQDGDLLIAISSSGSSDNIIKAVEVAKEKKCKVITLTGFKENNKLRQMGDYNIYIPSMEYGIVESIHNMVLQQIVDELNV
ncbi:SIS domain-containing protein [Pectinatus frisingensis]|uniref:SIS domain-containing protein n=1 Tax=Pectinatus frisingensis TaxID=865 RepID=UPI0018C69DC1|nr:SIS domain-containing protein [Pectinatus frisingensis]